MTDKAAVFNSLEDLGAGEGTALAKVLAGDASAAKNASAALGFEDPAGDLQYGKLDANGNMHVTLDGAGLCKGGHRALTVGSTSRTQVGADIALTAGKALSNIEWSVNNFRSTFYEVVVVDDPAGTPVETPVVDIMVGEGDFQDTGRMNCIDDIDTTGMTAPVLRIYGTNLKVASDFRARVTLQEAA